MKNYPHRQELEDLFILWAAEWEKCRNPKIKKYLMGIVDHCLDSHTFACSLKQYPHKDMTNLMTYLRTRPTKPEKY